MPANQSGFFSSRIHLQNRLRHEYRRINIGYKQMQGNVLPWLGNLDASEVKKPKRIDEKWPKIKKIYDHIVMLKEALDKNPMLLEPVSIEFQQQSKKIDMDDMIKALILFNEVVLLFNAWIVKSDSISASQEIETSLKSPAFLEKINDVSNSANNLSFLIDKELEYLACVFLSFLSYFFLYLSVSHGALFVSGIFACGVLLLWGMSLYLQATAQKNNLLDNFYTIIEELSELLVQEETTALHEASEGCRSVGSASDRSSSTAYSLLYDVTLDRGVITEGYDFLEDVGGLSSGAGSPFGAMDCGDELEPAASLAGLTLKSISKYPDSGLAFSTPSSSSGMHSMFSSPSASSGRADDGSYELIDAELPAAAAMCQFK